MSVSVVSSDLSSGEHAAKRLTMNSVLIVIFLIPVLSRPSGYLEDPPTIHRQTYGRHLNQGVKNTLGPKLVVM
jgi:hypothetical protein